MAKAAPLLDQLTDEAVAHVLPKLRAHIRSTIARSLGGAEAATLDKPAHPSPRKAAKRKPKGQPRKVEKAAAKVAVKAPAPKSGKRKRTSAADIVKHKETVLAACVRTAKILPSFKKADVECKIDDGDIDVGRMLSLLVADGLLLKSGEKRQTAYRLSAKTKPNGAVEHVVVRDAELASEEG